MHDKQVVPSAECPGLESAVRSSRMAFLLHVKTSGMATIDRVVHTLTFRSGHALAISWIMRIQAPDQVYSSQSSL